MKANIVIGANLGDEGKGTVVARLTKGRPCTLNILTNGGSQRGHSILTEDGSMTFQHFGSGTYFGADNYYSRYYILNPMQFVQEYDKLIVKPKVYRDKHCRWSTPYDVIVNIIENQRRGVKASCGMGIWKTVKRYNDLMCMDYDDFMSGEAVAMKFLYNVKLYYERQTDIPEEWKDVWNSNGLVSHFLNDCKRFDELTEVAEVGSLRYDNVIFENGQGLLLCDTGLNTIDTTPSDTGITYALQIAKEMGISDITAHYVTRPYLTRHGAGYIDNECRRNDLSVSVADDRTNHYNEYQGEFRYGMLDIDVLRRRVVWDARGIDFVLDVTHCDEMDRLGEFKRYFDNVNAIDTALV